MTKMSDYIRKFPLSDDRAEIEARAMAIWFNWWKNAPAFYPFKEFLCPWDKLEDRRRWIVRERAEAARIGDRLIEAGLLKRRLVNEAGGVATDGNFQSDGQVFQTMDEAVRHFAPLILIEEYKSIGGRSPDHEMARLAGKSGALFGDSAALVNTPINAARERLIIAAMISRGDLNHVHAECGPACDDRNCPYTHNESWISENKTYLSSAELSDDLRRTIFPTEIETDLVRKFGDDWNAFSEDRRRMELGAEFSLIEAKKKADVRDVLMDREIDARIWNFPLLVANIASADRGFHADLRRMPPWSMVQEVTGHGSTYSRRICERIGISVDEPFGKPEDILPKVSKDRLGRAIAGALLLAVNKGRHGFSHMQSAAMQIYGFDFDEAEKFCEQFGINPHAPIGRSPGDPRNEKIALMMKEKYDEAFTENHAGPDGNDGDRTLGM